MNNRIIVISLIFLLVFTNCATHTHIHMVGNGPEISNTTIVTKRQFYLCIGLIPLNTVDTNKMSNYSENYEIKTQVSEVDILIAAGLGLITFGLGPLIIQSRTVTVTM